jgi:hypothetical protein
MELQTRKLKAIGYLINLQDEKIFSKIESTILENQSVEKKKDFKPFTQKQLTDRARRSNKDYLAGKFKTQDQLELESENW